MVLRCSITDPHAGNTSQTGNGAVLGMLYEPDGTTPAVGVPVTIRPRNTLADTSGFGLPKRLADTMSVTTDDSGRYVFDSTLDTGTYVIEASSGDNAVLIDSVTVEDADTTLDLPPDTLKLVGALKGVISLSEGGDPRKVFVLAFGIDRFAAVDSLGAFRFQNLAEAAYDLRIVSSRDVYGVLDLPAVPVISADTTDLDTIELPFEGIPTVKGLALSYDTLRQIVTLTWEQADTALVSGYSVYREHQDSGLVKINSAPIADTTYSDSTALQDQKYTYLVKAVDKTGNEGLLSAGVGVEVVSAFALSATFGNGTGTADGYFNSMRAIAVDSSGNIFVADVLNYRIQKFDSTGAFLMAWGSEGSADSQFGRSIRDIALDSRGHVYVVDQGNSCIKKFDNEGNYLLKWGSAGPAPGDFDTPYSICVSRGYVFVGEYNGHRVQKFDLEGNYISGFAVDNPVVGLAVADSTLVIRDHEKKAILRYTESGELVDSSFTLTQQINSLFFYAGLTYAAIAMPAQIVAFDSAWTIAFSFGVQDTAMMIYPQDLVVVRDQHIFVAGSEGYFQRYEPRE
jgi:hypothetical protein